MTTTYPDYCALARPCTMAAALAFTALQLVADTPTTTATAAADQLRLALALLAPDDGGRETPPPPLVESASSAAARWGCARLARPGYRAAALVFTALQALGEYPEGAPDYDATAVEHLRLALAVLAPGFGNLQILGAPRPVTPPPLPFGPEEAPAAGPAWVKELLAEPEPEPPVGEHLWRLGEGVCARCGARARFAMGGQCSWRPEEPSTGTPAASEAAVPSTSTPAAPADLCEARSWTLFTASANELLYGSGLKAILEARAEDDPGFQVALACLQRREHQAAALALRPALAAWTPATTVQVREHGVLTLAGWLLGLRQFRGSELWPEKPSITARPEAARQCACPRRDARDCIVERSRPRGPYPAQIVDTDEVCECFCHQGDCEGDGCQNPDCKDPSCPWRKAASEEE